MSLAPQAPCIFSTIVDGLPATAGAGVAAGAAVPGHAGRQEHERTDDEDPGPHAVPHPVGGLLAEDPDGVPFNVYRETATVATPADGGPFSSRPDRIAGTRLLNDKPLTAGTWFFAATAYDALYARKNGRQSDGQGCVRVETWENSIY